MNRNASGGPQTEIRLGAPGDARAIAAVWAACEPTSVWAQLGTGLSSIYFRRYCAEPRELAVTAWLDGVLVGACVGTERKHGAGRRFYRRNGTALVRSLAGEVMARPEILAILARRVASGVAARRDAGGRNGRAGAALELDTYPGRWCYVANFFVAPAARGRRLGALMLKRFASEMADRGLEWCLVHTEAENVASQITQRRCGFECVDRHGDDLWFARRCEP